MVEESKKMERLILSGSDSETLKERSHAPSGPEENVTESRASPDLHKDLRDLTSQVQMMSDSLAACRQMSKYLSLRKAYDVADRTTPQTSNTVSTPAEEKHQRKTPMQDVIISYMTNRNDSIWQWLETMSVGSAETGLWDYGQKERTSSYPVDIRRRKPKRKMQKMDAEAMVELIRRELKALVYLAPSVSLLASLLSDTILKYAGRAKCSKSFSSVLPWILHRVQELIVYVAIKHQETPTAFNTPGLPSEKEYDQKKSVSIGSESVLPPEESSILIGKSNRIDANATTEAKLGVQFVLLVKPEIRRKRLLERGKRKSVKGTAKCTAVHLKEPIQYSPVTLVLKPNSHREVVWERKQSVTHPRECSFGVCLVFPFVNSSAIQYLQFVPKGTVTVFHRGVSRETLNLQPAASFQEQTLQWNKNIVTLLSRKTGLPGRDLQDNSSISITSSFYFEEKLSISPRERSPKPSSPGSTRSRRCSNEKKSYSLQNFLANAPDLVKELLREAEMEKLEIKKLEEEALCLKNLLLEIHKNQIELSKFLLKKGIYTKSVIKLTNPKMLEEESEAIKQLENCFTGKGNYSVENVLEQMREIKERCTLKNKMVTSLIEGLRNDVPVDTWEEIFSSSAEKDSKEREEELEEGKGKSWPSALDDKKAPRKKSQAEEQSTEEEPNTKGKMGANVMEELVNHSKDGDMMAETKADTSHLDRIRTWAFPAYHVSEVANSCMMKLENQISVLNVENGRLWQEVHRLRGLLADSIKDVDQRRTSTSMPIVRLSEQTKTGKTIKLTIQIAREKSRRSSTNSELLKINDVSEYCSVESFGEPTSNTNIPKKESKDLTSSPNTGTNQELPPTFIHQTSQQVMVATPHPSGHILHPIRPAKVRNSHPGPSDRQPQHLLLKPSVMEIPDLGPDLHEMISNERQLQPILESDSMDSSLPSEVISQTIQRLRMRMRFIHKEVTALKLKNDKTEKLLDRLLQTAFKNNSNPVENSLV